LNNQEKFVKYFQFSHISDEFFFQTMLINSPLKDTIVNNSLRYIRWSSGSYVPNPIVLDKTYFDDMTTSDKLFARKFDLTKDAQVLDMLDAVIEQAPII
jgi:hypothetical protein